MIFLLLVYNHLIGVVPQLAMKCCPTHFRMDGMSVNLNGVFKDSFIVHKGTIEICLPGIHRRFTFVPWSWFNSDIKPEMGRLHDCYIAENDTITNCFRLIRNDH